MTMDTMAAVAAKKLSKLVAEDFREIFGSSHDDLAERVGGLARITIEYLGRSDALYHNFEHTVLVTTVGRDILLGRTLSERWSWTPPIRSRSMRPSTAPARSIIAFWPSAATGARGRSETSR